MFNLKKYLNFQKLELWILVAVKAGLFYLIWLFFFSHPAAEKIDDKAMVDRIFQPVVLSEARGGGDD